MVTEWINTQTRSDTHSYVSCLVLELFCHIILNKFEYSLSEWHLEIFAIWKITNIVACYYTKYMICFRKVYQSVTCRILKMMLWRRMLMKVTIAIWTTIKPIVEENENILKWNLYKTILYLNMSRIIQDRVKAKNYICVSYGFISFHSVKEEGKNDALKDCPRVCFVWV